jgi:hypothetical protein
MNKGGVPDAWDDDWERAADVSDLCITLQPEKCVANTIA